MRHDIEENGGGMVFVRFPAKPLLAVTERGLFKAVEFILAICFLPVAGVIFHCTPRHELGKAGNHLVLIRHPGGTDKIKAGLPLAGISDHTGVKF